MNSLNSKPQQAKILRLLYKSLYLLAFGFFLFKVYQYHHINFGYSTLPMFSQTAHEQSLDSLKETPHYTFPDNLGYDGQFYAQLALDPKANSPEIQRALDNYSYRARRILFSWSAWALGIGDPYWIIQAYSIQNALFWFLTAILLLKWLPANSWQNTLRFLSCMFTAGLVYSFNRALLDGPSLFLIVLGISFIEANRSWLGTATLGLAGLGKETNLLAITALWKPDSTDAKAKIRFALQAILAILPFLLWFSYILNSDTSGQSKTMGANNFTLPFAGYFSAVLEVLRKGGDTGFPARTFMQFAMLASLLIQAAYLFLRPKPNRAWWRVGVTFAVLMLVLGDAVWEGVEAAPRVLLPMTFAFNLLFSRKTVLLPILIFANSLSIVGLSSMQTPIVTEQFELKGQLTLAYDSATNQYETLLFQNGWYIYQGDQKRYWRWSSGYGETSFRIPGDQDVNTAFSFILKTIEPRELYLEVNGETVWQFQSPGGYSEIQSASFILKAGENVLKIYSPQPTSRVGADPRSLNFALYNYKIDLISPVSN